jgi:hypothetical protein
VAGLSAGALLLYLVALGLGGLGTLVVAFRRDTALDPAPPLTLAIALAALTCFGGGGILALRLFTFSGGRSLVAALLFAALGAALFGSLAASARRSTARGTGLADLVGALAAVTIAIEPGKHGAIAPRFTSPPRTLIATSAHKRTLPVGTTVVVTALRGAPGREAAEVAPLPTRDSRHAAD